MVCRVARCVPIVVVCVLVFASFGLVAPVAAGNDASYAGITFRQLSTAELDSIQRNTGYRLGVFIVTVTKSSPAAGLLTAGSVVLVIGKQGVTTPAAAIAALKKAPDTITIAALVNVQGQFVPKTFALALGVHPAVPPTSGAHPLTAVPANAPASQPHLSSTDDLISAYYDLLDFMRTQAWSKTYTTPPSERARVMTILRDAWPQMNQGAQAGVMQIATAWFNLKKAWPTLSAAKRTAVRRGWRTFLLLPTMIFPPLDHPQTYTSSTGSFQYPNGWSGGETQDATAGYLFLGPGGARSSWPAVLNTATSPEGALLIQAPVTADAASLTPLQGARLYEQQFFGTAPGFTEIVAQGTNQGAFVALRGRFPGQTEEKFYWIVLVPVPSGTQYVVCRMGGAVARADTLVPALWNILASVTYVQSTSSSSSSSGSSGSGETVAAWDTAWSKVSTGVVANIWAPSGN